MTGIILTDLQKAFDTIDHDILLQILYAIAFSKHLVNWFRSYLINRTFFVNLGNAFSQPVCVSSGVPQGSILDPQLFAIYVNDTSKLPNVIFCFTLMIHALSVNIMILRKLKNS